MSAEAHTVRSESQSEPEFRANSEDELVNWLQRKLDRFDTSDLDVLLEAGGFYLGYGHFINVFKN